MTNEATLLSLRAPTGSSGLWVEHWRYRSEFRKGPGRHCHAIYLNPQGIRYDGKIADSQVRCGGSTQSIAIVPAGADCSLQVQARSVDAFALCIEQECLSAFAIKSGLPAAGIHEGVIDDATMHHLSRALLSAMDDAGSSRTLVCEAVSQAILTHLLDRHAHRLPPRAGSLSPRALSRTLDYINDNLEGTITLDALAEIACLSVFHFSRAFARSTGHPPHRYVMLARIERAVALLRGSSLPLAEIACRTGFADQSHMARLVRERHGISPRALRRACES